MTLSLLFLTACEPGFQKNPDAGNSTTWLKAPIRDVEIIDGNTLRVKVAKGHQITGTGKIQLNGIGFHNGDENRDAKNALATIFDAVRSDDHDAKFRCEPDNGSMNERYNFKDENLATCSIGGHPFTVKVDVPEQAPDGMNCNIVERPDNKSSTLALSPALLQLGLAYFSGSTHRPDRLKSFETNAINCKCGIWHMRAFRAENSKCFPGTPLDNAG